MTKSQLKMLNDAEAKASHARRSAQRAAEEFKRLNTLADEVMAEALAIVAEEHEVKIGPETVINFKRDEKTKQIVGAEFGVKTDGK